MESKLTVFIDLDDTLIDTFNLLIRPLEQLAAAKICESEGIPAKAEELAAKILACRKQSPTLVDEEIRRFARFNPDVAIRIHNDIFTDFDISQIYVENDVVATLGALQNLYNTVLITEGQVKIQKQKIEDLSIGRFFCHHLFIDGRGGFDKASAMREYLDAFNIPINNAVIVGNRLDRDILAGNRLGISTIWLRSGEGSEMRADIATGTPNRRIEKFSEVPAVIDQLFGAS